jgi:hypothetical protein
MTDWYVEISSWAPEKFRSDEYLGKVIDTATPYMDYFCQRLTEIKDWRLEDANRIFKEIIEEMPIMVAEIWNGQFRIRYNKFVYIQLTETPIQIYRESKINRILA